MSREITVFVAGIPKTAGSKRPFLIRNKAGVPVMKNGRPVIVVTDTSGKAGKDWRGDIRAVVMEKTKGAAPTKGPWVVDVTLYFPRPKSHFGSGKNAAVLKPGCPRYHCIKPDASKCFRALEDALTGILWTDDACIVSQGVAKDWSVTQPGAAIRATDMGADAQAKNDASPLDAQGKLV